jgi:hypothetical protein
MALAAEQSDLQSFSLDKWLRSPSSRTEFPKDTEYLGIPAQISLSSPEYGCTFLRFSIVKIEIPSVGISRCPDHG